MGNKSKKKMTAVVENKKQTRRDKEPIVCSTCGQSFPGFDLAYEHRNKRGQPTPVGSVFSPRGTFSQTITITGDAIASGSSQVATSSVMVGRGRGRGRGSSGGRGRGSSGGRGRGRSRGRGRGRNGNLFEREMPSGQSSRLSDPN